MFRYFNGTGQPILDPALKQVSAAAVEGDDARSAPRGRVAVLLPDHTIRDLQPGAVGPSPDGSRQSWTCRRCCRRAGTRYTYAERADAYCAGCGGPLSEVELLATTLKQLMRDQGTEALGYAAGPVRTPGPLLDVNEAADLLRTTPGAIRARAERGQLPGLVRDGRRIRVRRDLLLRSLERRAPSPGRSR